MRSVSIARKPVRVFRRSASDTDTKVTIPMSIFRNSIKLACAAAIATYAIVASAQETVNPVGNGNTPSVVVSGVGEAAMRPEIARIIIAVSTTDQSVPKASAANRETSDRVIAKIQALNIKSEDVKTLNFQVSRFYEPNRKLNSTGSSDSGKFEANHQLQIMLRDIDSVGRIIGSLLTIDDLTFQSVTWDINKPITGDDKAREAAVVDARHRAEIYATAANVKLGRLIAIRDGSGRGVPFNDSIRVATMAKGGDPSIPILPPANVTFSASVQMVWEILPK